MIKVDKESKKLLKNVRKMNVDDEMRLHGYDVICVEKQFYLLIHPVYGIFEKHYNEIKDWIVSGGEVE